MRCKFLTTVRKDTAFTIEHKKLMKLTIFQSNSAVYSNHITSNNLLADRIEDQ